MCTLRRPTVLLILTTTLLGPAGCSSTSGVRVGTAPKIKTIAAVGDKPLPVVTGEPGSAVAADDYTPERRVDKAGRLSGRVFDEQGEPVPNARVRLALGEASGGKVVNATTDRSGGFTLHGLRPGASYTLIAETKDKELGVLSGRAEARAPETDVRITLLPDEEGAPPARAARGVSTVSRPNEEGDGQEEPAEGTGRIPDVRLREELLPPAPEADTLLPSRARRPRAPLESESPMTARWRRGETGPPTRSATTGDRDSGIPEPDESDYDDDGHNPLPPAIEPGQDETPDRTSANFRGAGKARAPTGSRVLVPENYTPIALADRPAPYGSGAEPAAGASGPPGEPPRRTSPSQPPPAVPWYDAKPAAPGDETPRVAHEESSLVKTDPGGATPTRRRRTWGDVTASHGSVSQGRAMTIAQNGPAPTNAAARPADEAIAYCRFDAKSRRIVDFALPDVQGKPLHFKDLDSDLVLIDFWGTWCKPCLSSIPHLVDLQNRLGGKHLTIVGIASEQGPPQARQAAVAQAVQRLGINYPILLSGMDGLNCPVQEALHIQAFPTLILVDRQGRILWRDQGATPATLARLDQFIAGASTPDVVRR